MTAEEHLKIMVGNMAFRIAELSDERDTLRDQLTEARKLISDAPVTLRPGPPEGK
jgi:hypothetical protein